MSLRYICTYDRGDLVMDDDEYLRTIRRFLHALVLVAEINNLAAAPAVTRAKAAESGDVLEHQRALFGLIDLAKDNGLNGNDDVNEAKELIRCRVLGCGLAGACNGGHGDVGQRCPLWEGP
jgi:hypothetical protein